MVYSVVPKRATSDGLSEPKVKQDAMLQGEHATLSPDTHVVPQSTTPDGQPRYILLAPQPMPDESKQVLKGKYDDALIKSLKDYFLKLKNDGEVFFFSPISERPVEFIYNHIRLLVANEYRMQKSYSLDKTCPKLDRLVAALGNEKISDQLSIFQLVNYTRMLEYLKSPELAKKGIESVKCFTQLVEDRKQGKIDSDKFSRDATIYIQQMREVFPKQSLAWLLLDKIAICVALIVLPIAITNGLYHKLRSGKFCLGFFDTQAPENKYINHIEEMLNQRPDLPLSPIVA
ncbi:hypothetical protein RVIR1_10790 [Candidatus Rickettsiella viridis]|uniref:Uncharacterized protein n=1 Tax=Candidatus Rickettsiella viridis TaxID=676208 RepID=A0A2Z5V7L4_9COXI|nr:hypothetical protein [Candidatus Rickettsiella viridis]BBB15547.1 hypothetical protein RVIR1_10790 [Candidatus Rickettsiella viridis]